MSIRVDKYNTRTNNILVFQNTRTQSHTVYYAESKRLEEATLLYEEPHQQINIGDYGRYKVNEPTNIKFSYGGTVSTAYKYSELGESVAMLNFADALQPGGLVKSGEVTQEENICRCTNLYESLTTPKALVNYYERNERLLGIYPHYTNTLIYSPNVLIFKDDRDYAPIPKTFVDVITCPSPQGGDTAKMAHLLKERISGIIKSAIANYADVLILGAWGCGAFGQNPEVMARLFGEVIAEYKYYRYFKTIDFAIRNNDGSKSGLAEIFETNFWKGYENGTK